MRMHIAHGFWARLKGLTGCTLWPDEVLVLIPCRAIHTFTMREPIDVAFVDRDGWVIESLQGLPPGRHRSCRGAVATLERLSHGRGEAWFEAGERIDMGRRAS